MKNTIIAISLLAVLVVAGLFTWRTVEINRHRNACLSLREQMLKHPPTDPKHYTFLSQWQEHKGFLVTLGYFTTNTFQIVNLRNDGPRGEALLEETRNLCPDDDPVDLLWSGDSNLLTVWDRPQKMKIWEELIRKHDVPPMEGGQQ